MVVGDHALQQGHELGQMAFDGAALEQRRGIPQAADDALVLFVQRELQIKLSIAALCGDGLQAHIGQHQLGIGDVLPGEHHLEHRLRGQTPLGIERLDHLFERHVLMILRCQCGGTHLRQQIGDAGRAAQVDAQRLGVDEEADQSFEFAARAVGDRRADHDLILTGQSRQQHGPAGQHGHEHGGAVALAQRTQRGGEVAIEGDLDTIAAIILQCRTRVIGGQFQQRRCAMQMCTPERELPLQQRPIEPAALPQAVVGVLDRQRRQRIGLALREGGIQRAKLAQQDADGPAIGDAVVHADQQALLLLGQL